MGSGGNNCCCINLRTGNLILGYFGIILSVSSLIEFVFVMIYQIDFKDNQMILQMTFCGRRIKSSQFINTLFTKMINFFRH